MSKVVSIKCKGNRDLSIDQVHDFQGELKNLTSKNYEKLKKLILKLGYSEPISVWLNPKDKKWMILNGHQRLRVLKTMQKKEGYTVPPIPVSVVEAKDWKEAKAKVLAMTSQFGEITAEGLLHFMEESKLDFGLLEDLRFPELKLDDLIKSESPGGKTDEDDVPTIPKKPLTKRGDLYLLGEHRVLCGDSTNIQHVERLMAGQKADMVFTDPPYRMITEGGKTGPIGKAHDSRIARIKHLCEFEPEAFLEILPLVFSKDVMNSYVFCNKDLVPDYLSWAKKLGYSFNILIWKKPNALPVGGNHWPDIEYLLLFRKSAIFNNSVKDVIYSKCLVYGRETNENHPTVKPVKLIENEILISSNKGSPILDFFGGSGSTIIACEKTDRKCFMMEIDPHYCSVIIERWSKFTGKEAYLVELDGHKTPWSKLTNERRTGRRKSKASDV